MVRYSQALRDMPKKTRRIFLMHRLRQMTYADIAQYVGIGESGVEYRMARALARCREVIATPIRKVPPSAFRVGLND